MEMSLGRIRDVCSNMGAGKTGFTIIVAGTNGKGSTISMLEAALVDAGNKTGTYTSPHLVRFNERIKIDGQECTDQQICMAFCEIESSRAGISLTYFEYATLCALLLFRNNLVDVSLLEIGMGGRFDAVNMIDGDLAVITSIGIDHEAWLGNDRETIAAEKAGIIRKGMTVVCSDPKIPQRIVEICEQQQAQLLALNRDFTLIDSDSGYAWKSNHPRIPGSWRSLDGIYPPLPGSHQLDNLAGVIAALALCSGETGVRDSRFAYALQGNRLMARCQVIGMEPLIIVDVAHNRDSTAQLASFLEANEVAGKSIAVFGVLADKALDRVLQPLQSMFDLWILVSLGGERGQSASELAAKFNELGGNRVLICKNNPVEAYREAMARAKKHDRIVIFGSFHTVGDIIGSL
jgi:dihydrofolate synthase/folylpolyglutamate synthase